MISDQSRLFVFIVHFVAILFIFLTLPYGNTTSLQPALHPCSDYEMLIVNTKQCVSRCPIRCENGTCFEDGVCPCEGFYQTSQDNGLVCAATCLSNSTICVSGGGYCAASDLCLCGKGFYFNPVARKCWKGAIFKDLCLGGCLYGSCNYRGECICAEGYTNRTALLGQLCQPICTQDCGRHGFCFAPNMCACKKKHYHYDWDGVCRKDMTYLGRQPVIKFNLRRFLENVLHL